MKKAIFIVLISALAACGSNGGVEAVGDSASVKMDTTSTGSNSGTMNSGSTGGAAMNADTTGMGIAR